MGIAVLLATLSVVLTIAGVILLPIVIVRLPEDCFARTPGESRWPDWSFSRKVQSVGRGVLGLVLVCVGATLLLLPGQGVLTILAGIAVAEFPGKIRLERWILRQPGVLSGLNGIRRRFGKAPFRLEN